MRDFSPLAVEPSGIPQDAVLPSADLKRIVDGMLAVGVPLEEALASAILSHGEVAVKPLWEAFLGRGRSGREVMEVLDGIAEAAPETANAWLNQGLAEGRIWEWLDSYSGFHLEGRNWIRNLPEDLEVVGNLYLGDCKNLSRLPDRMKVHGALDVRDCLALESLPDGLRVNNRSLFMVGCSKLRTLPKGMVVEGWLNLEDCTSLQDLPADLKVGRSLSLGGCESLRAIGEGLEVGGNLDLGACVALVRLPDHLKVGESMDLQGCSALAALPEGLEVQNALYCPAHLLEQAKRMRQEGRIQVGRIEEVA